MPQIVYLGSNQQKPKSRYYRIYKNTRDSIYKAFTTGYNIVADILYINQFFSWLFSWNLQEGNAKERRLFAGTNKDITDAKARTQSEKESLSLIQRAIFSGNVLIAALGLNFAYVVVHLVTLWGFHIFFKGAVGLTAALSLMTLPILIYLGLAISDAIDEIKRNLVYERLKEKKQKKIAELESKLLELLDANERLILHIGDHYKQLTFSNNVQSWFEGLKKSTRWMVLFTVLLALEWAVGVSTGVFIGSAISGAAILFVDWRAQRKVARHDLKIREMNQKIALLRKTYVARKISSMPSRIKSSLVINATSIPSHLLFSSNARPAPTPPSKLAPLWSFLIAPWWDPYIAPLLRNMDKVTKGHLLKIDNFLALFLVTAGYVAYSMITIFAAHEHVLGAGSALADGLLYGIPGLFAVLIGAINIYANNNLYEFHRTEKFRLQGELDAIKLRTLGLIRENSFNRDIIDKLTEYANHVSDDPWIEEYCQAPKKWYKEKESFKKFLRVLTMAFFFFAVGLLTPTGIGAVIAIGIVAAGLDYYVRSHKGKIESELKDLQKQQLIALKVQEILVDNLATNAETAVKLQVNDRPGDKIVQKMGIGVTPTIPTDGNSHLIVVSADDALRNRSGNGSLTNNAADVNAQSTPQPAPIAIAAHSTHSKEEPITHKPTTAPILPFYAKINAREGEPANSHESEEIVLATPYDDKDAEILNIRKPTIKNPLPHTWENTDKPVAMSPNFKRKMTLVN